MTEQNPPESTPENGPPEESGRIDYLAVQQSEAFGSLRKTHRSFVFPMAVFFIVWYAVYVLLGAYAHDFMARPLFGTMNVGIFLGILQFVTTFVITTAYVMYANRRMDPQSEAIRADLERQEAGR